MRAIDVLQLIAGLVFLIAGAELLVRGATAISARMGIPAMVVGLTIVSFGTSLPELLVALISGSRGNSDLAIASVLGSNVCNVLLVLGISAMVRDLPVGRSVVVTEIPFSLAAALLVGFLANAALFTTEPDLRMSRIDGMILLSFFLLFMIYVYQLAGEERADELLSGRRLWSAVGLVVAGTVALYFGGQWSVDGALGVAARFGVANATVGLTVVAIGTSSPELVASAVAAFRGQTDIAVGNVVGSNIFNLLWILGLTSVAVELPFKAITNTDIVMVIASSMLVILALIVGRAGTITRLNGAVFLALYAVYLFTTIDLI